MSSASESEEALASLYALHEEIDRESGRLAQRHAERLRCARGCSACCLDDLTVFPVEAERIRREHAALLENARPAPEGRCAFLDPSGACRIYADRPAVCRTQGLPLRLLLEDEAEEIVEHRDICPLNLEGGPALDALEEDDCWLIGPHELRLAAIDARFREGAIADDPRALEGGERIALRGLFERVPER